MTDPAESSTSPNEPLRYTVDGSEALESLVRTINERVTADIHKIVPQDQIDGLVLAGGYGRGEGGIFVTDGKERLYNDLDYYLFLKGNRRQNEQNYGAALKEIERTRTPEADCDVEFKIDSISQLESSAVTMFSYDLVTRSAIVDGSPDLFAACDHHRNAGAIPATEASRLLFNRCSGLLFAHQRLHQASFSADDLEFVQRNFAKVQLALGDALLTLQGQYHWSCRERAERIKQLALPDDLPQAKSIQQVYPAGVAFKLRPQHPPTEVSKLLETHKQLSELAQDFWLWLESKRLQRPFAKPQDYAHASGRLFPEAPAWRNFLVNLRHFGGSTLTNPHRFRYPRERLMRALCLLLWSDAASEGEIAQLLQAPSTDRDSLISQFETLWHVYG